MKLYFFLLLIFVGLSGGRLSAQTVGVKTNLAYLATTTPNVGLEFKMGQNFTMALHGGYNPFDFPSFTYDDGTKSNTKFRHWLVMPEMKYWFCKAFERSYLSLYGLYGEFNVGGIEFTTELRDRRYNGYTYGGGISYGYQWALGERWGLEFSAGIGYMYMNYKTFVNGRCGKALGEYVRNYFGPNKFELSFVYFLK